MMDRDTKREVAEAYDALGGRKYDLRYAEEQESKRSTMRRSGIKVIDVFARVEQLFNLTRKDLCDKRRRGTISQARAVLCKWLLDELGMTTTAIARELSISQQAVQKCIVRGRAIVEKSNLILS